MVLFGGIVVPPLWIVVVTSMLMLQEAGARTSGSRAGGRYSGGGYSSAYRGVGSTYRSSSYSGGSSGGTYSGSSSGGCGSGVSSGSSVGDLGNITSGYNNDSQSGIFSGIAATTNISQNDDQEPADPDARPSWANSPQAQKALDIFCFLISNGLDYRGMYTNITSGSFCVNNHVINGYPIGQFQCPVDGFEPNDLYCCGSSGFQYCCDDLPRSSSLSLSVVIPLLAVLTVIVITVYCCKKHANLRRFWYFSRPVPTANRQVIYATNCKIIAPLPLGNMIQPPSCPMMPYTTGGERPEFHPPAAMAPPPKHLASAPGFTGHQDEFNLPPSYPYQYSPQPPPQPPHPSEHPFYSPAFATYPASTGAPPPPPPPPPTYDQVIRTPYPPVQIS